MRSPPRRRRCVHEQHGSSHQKQGSHQRSPLPRGGELLAVEPHKLSASGRRHRAAPQRGQAKRSVDQDGDGSMAWDEGGATVPNAQRASCSFRVEIVKRHVDRWYKYLGDPSGPASLPCKAIAHRHLVTRRDPEDRTKTQRGTTYNIEIIYSRVIHMSERCAGHHIAVFPILADPDKNNLQSI